MKVLICNKDNPHQGCESIPLPIPDEEYDHCMELLKALGVGGVVARDCYVDQIEDAPPVLDVLRQQEANIDELDFLARSLDRYTDAELAKFQCMAVARGYTDMVDLVNLSFCCEQTTVITDFSDLEKIGKNHYLATHGGVPTDVYDALNGVGIARKLIASGEGIVTPYGVVYENGFKLEQSYQGRAFPTYYCTPSQVDVKAVLNGGNEETFLQLPMPRQRLERMLERGGITADASADFEIASEGCKEPVMNVIKNEFASLDRESVFRLNEFCEVIGKLSNADQKKLAAAVLYAEPEYSCQIRQLAENLDLFDFIPDIKTPEDYGKYMIQQSGHFDFDENLIGFYDYKGYGEQRIASESGTFNEMGYISYHGTLSLEELMMEEPSEQAPVQGQAMGGLT